MSDVLEVYDISTEAIEVITEGPQGPPGPAGDGTLGYYGAFSDYTSQTITSITAAYAMTLNTTDESNGVSRGTPTSKIEFTNAATYNVQWSGQFQNTNNTDHDVRVWLKKNGTDVVGSTGFASIPSSHGQVNGHTIIGWNYILTLAAGDYLQFYWSADSTAVSIETYTVGTNPTTPSTASLIVTAQQVMNLQLGPAGPQGPAGTAGGISSVALAGTGLSISGSPITTSGTITANVAYGTTAGTACEGNDGRIATIGNGAINTATGVLQVGLGGGSTETLEVYSADRSGLADIKAYSLALLDDQNTGKQATLYAPSLTLDRTHAFPNESGTVALTQQATDIEITDPTKGYILNSATKRWRLTIDDNGVLLRTALALLFSLSFMCGAKAQVRDLVYNTNNVVIGPTNTNALSFTNSVAFSNPITFGTNATTTRTNLGVTVASNLPAPWSGGASSNSLLTADGAGSSAFVSTIPKLTIASGTITNTNPALSISQTWSNTNVAFTGLVVNITNTGSSNTSTLADFQVAGSTRQLTYAAGDLVTEFGSASAGRSHQILLWGNGTGRSHYIKGSTTLGLVFNYGTAGSHAAIISASSQVIGFRNRADGGISWTSDSNNADSGTADLLLIRDAANTLASRNGTNAQTYNLYNTFSNSTNYERGKIAWTNNVLTIGTEKGSGGGTARNVSFVADGAEVAAIYNNNTAGTPNGLWVVAGCRMGTLGRGSLFFPAAGGATIWNSAETDFTLLRFGGTTTNFPALKRTNTVLQVRLADDSAYTTLDAQHRLQGTAPTNSTDTGTAGDIRYDTNNFLYICVSSNTWRRTSLTNW